MGILSWPSQNDWPSTLSFWPSQSEALKLTFSNRPSQNNHLMLTISERLEGADRRRTTLYPLILTLLYWPSLNDHLRLTIPAWSFWVDHLRMVFQSMLRPWYVPSSHVPCLWSTTPMIRTALCRACHPKSHVMHMQSLRLYKSVVTTSLND